MDPYTLPPIFKHAKEISYFGDHRARIGASLIFKGRPLSLGFNQKLRTHPLAKQFCEFATIHAELSCIIRCRNKSMLSRCTMVIFRELRNGKIGYCRPCLNCQKILKLYNISHIMYTTETGYEEDWL